MEEIVKEPFMLREPGAGIREAMFKQFESVGLKPKVRMEVGNNEAIKHAVVGGLGLSVLSLHTISLESIDGPVAILDVVGFPILRKWYIVHPKAKELSLVAKTFLDFAAAHEPKIRQRMLEIWPALVELLAKDEATKNEKGSKTKTKKTSKKKVISKK